MTTRVESSFYIPENIRSQVLKPVDLQNYLQQEYKSLGHKVPFDLGKFSVGIRCGGERIGLRRAAYVGDFSILTFKGNEPGFLASFAVCGRDLDLLQLQGAKTRAAYLTNTYFRWVRLMADLTVALATKLDGIERITMPHAILIPGITGAASSEAMNRYEAFQGLLKMEVSPEEKNI